MSVRAGWHRRRIEIQERVESRSDLGGPTWTWQTATSVGNEGHVWCSIEPNIGRERFAAEQVQSEIEGRIRMRYMTGINAKMRGYEAATETYFDFLSPPLYNARRTEMFIDYKVREADGWRE